MKLKSILLITSLCIIFSCGASKDVPLNDLTVQGFKGQIKKIEIEHFENRNNQSAGVMQLKKLNKTVIEYNQRGQKTKHYYYNNDDSLFMENSYTYNQQGLLAEISSQVPELNSDIKSDFKYNEKQEVTGITIYDGGQVYQKIAFRYNEAGNISEITHLSDTGEVTERSSYKYDQNPQKKQILLCYNVNADSLLEKENIRPNSKVIIGLQKPIFNIKSFETDDILLSSLLTPLNKTGNLTEKTTYKKDGSLKQIEKYLYDKKGNLLEQEVLDHQGHIMSKKQVEYKANNTVSSITLSPEGEIKLKEHLLFNRKDNLTHYVKTNASNIFQGKHEYVSEARKKRLTKKILSFEDQLYEKSVFSYDKKINIVDYSYFRIINDKEVLKFNQKVKYTYYN